MAHGLGEVVEDTVNAVGRGLTSGEWYYGDYKGSDETAREVIGMGNKMREDLGGSSPGEISWLLERYEATGEMPEGRMGDVLKSFEESKQATTGEYNVKEELAGYGVETAKSGVEKARLAQESAVAKGAEIEGWLEGNLSNLTQEGDIQAQKSGGMIGGPTRGATMKKERLRDASETKWDAYDRQVDLADIGVTDAQRGVDIAEAQGSILGFQESKELIGLEKDKMQQINQMKDLIYELETQEMQFT